MYDFAPIANLLPFLSNVNGPEAEILLCDTEHILVAEHPITDRVKPGNRIGDMERSFLEEGTYKTTDSIVNYRALLPSGERLRASTLFLKNEDGSLAGFLTINVRVENLLHIRDMIDRQINGGTERKPIALPQHQKSSAASAPQTNPRLVGRYDEVNIAIKDIISSVTGEYLSGLGVPAERLTPAERQQVVRELDKRGVFLVKGSISDVAKRLGCSDVTIYRYLQMNDN